MLQNNIGVLEGIDVNKTGKSKDCNICHYWYFLNEDFQQNISNGCPNVLMVSMNLSDIAILNNFILSYSKQDFFWSKKKVYKPLHKMLPKTSTNGKSCDDQTKWL